MVNKILGYILFGLGVVGVGLSYEPVRDAIGLTSLPSALLAYDGLVLLIVGAAVLIAGAFLAFRGSSGKQAEEVPIYHGKKIVGYRRMK